MAKTRYPLKQEIINTLLNEHPNQKGMDKLMLIVEHKKISNNLGIIKGELLSNGKIVARGSMTCLPKKSEESFDWSRLKNDESFFDGFSLDFPRETFGKMFIEGLKKSIKEGKIPFFRNK